MIRLVAETIDPRAVADAVRGPENGALLVFEGVGRATHEGRVVRGLEYEAFPEMAVPEMERIAAEVTERWPDARVALVHRTGRVAIGEPSVVIAVAAPHREACYAASRYAIDELKRRVPIWKKELYVEGDTAWIGNRA